MSSSWACCHGDIPSRSQLSPSIQTPLKQLPLSWKRRAAHFEYATFYQSLMLCTVGNVVSYGLAYGLTKPLYGFGSLKLHNMAVKRTKTDMHSICSSWKITTLVAVFSKVINIMYNICQGGQGSLAEMLKRERERERGIQSPVITPH